MVKNYDALIIGGGINGCSIGYQLAKKGYKTAIVEKNTIASEASSAAAGMLGAQVEFAKNDAYFQFALQSRKLFPELIGELEQLTGINVGFKENGMVKIACSKQEVNHLLKVKKIHEEAGLDAQWWSEGNIRKYEPKVSDQAIGALYIAKDSQVIPEQLTTAFARAAMIKGVDIYEYTEVLAFIESENRVQGVQTDHGNMYADFVITAAGAWTERLVNELPMVPVKGEIISVRSSNELIKRTVHAADFYIVPKAGGSLYIGATEKHGTFDKQVTIEGIYQLLKKAKQLIPELQEAAFETAWTGVRPQTFDGKPYLGKGRKAGLWAATGHFRNGILLSAITGKWLADLIEGKSEHPEWEEAFSPERLRMKGEKKLEINY